MSAPHDPDTTARYSASEFTDLIRECRAEIATLEAAGWRRAAPCWWVDPLDGERRYLFDEAVRAQSGRGSR